MRIPYKMRRVLEGKETSFLKESTRNPKAEAEFLMGSNHMKGYYLGDCIDSCRWGSIMTIMYKMDIKNIIGFIQSWMRQNENSFQNLFHERNWEDLQIYYKRTKN
ncbi:MAG: hypothetical protein AABW56_01180 [Nanoarchaeota archaeon]|mgnify:FL=1